MQVDLTPQLEDSERPREVPFFFPYTQLKDSFLRGEKKMGVSTYRCLNTWGRDPVFLLYNIIYFLGSDFTLLSLFLRAFAKSRESYCFPFSLSFFDRFFFYRGDRSRRVLIRTDDVAERTLSFVTKGGRPFLFFLPEQQVNSLLLLLLLSGWITMVGHYGHVLAQGDSGRYMPAAKSFFISFH